MPRYADLDNLIADYIPEAKSERDKAAVGRILDAASRFVDSYCKRADDYFAPNSDPEFPYSTKRIRGEGYNFLRLPVNYGVLGIENFRPEEDFYVSEKGWAYFFDRSRLFPEGELYRVSAYFGYKVVPPQISEAVRLIVARIYSVQKGTIGQITAEGFIQERLIPAAAKDLLQSFIKREFER